MFKFWKIIPIARLLLPFALGIVLSSYFPNVYDYAQLTLSSAVAVVTMMAALLLKHVHLQPWFQVTFGVLLNLSYVLIGYWGALISNQQFTHDEHLSLDYYYVTIEDTYQEKDKSYKYTAFLKGAKSRGNKILLYTAKSYLLHPGDEFIVHGKPQRIAEVQNPEQFNYQRYLWHKNLRYQMYCSAPPPTISSHNHWKKWATHGRLWALSVLHSNLDHQAYALSSALVLGDKDYIDTQLMRAFSKAGATHVLAVSGLHVGIVFLLVQFIFGRLPNARIYKVAKMITGLTVIWTYAYLTGLSASVSRAATMFSFVLIGQVLYKRSNVFNNIGSSAFILMILSPYILMEVGFQLSYSAVIGIVYFQPKFKTLLSFNYWLPRKIWELTTVSISAQLATFPLALLYFHQFPNYFLVSNLLVIPLTFVLVPLGLLALTFHSFSVISVALFTVLQWMLNLLQWSVDWLNQLNWSSTQEVHISTIETWMFYAIIFTGTHYWMRRTRWSMVLFTAIILSTITYNIQEVIQQQEQKKLIVYDTPSFLSIDFIEGQHLYHYGTHPTGDTDYALFFFEHLRWKDNVIYRDSLTPLNGWLFTSNFNVFIADSSAQYLPQNHDIDAIIVMPSFSAHFWLDYWGKAPILFSGPWRKKDKAECIDQLQQRQIHYVDIEKTGAFTLFK